MDTRVPTRHAVLAGALSILLLATLPLHADEARDLLNETLAELSGVTAVRANIEQEIDQAGIKKRFAGRYVAADGKFRVELSKPSSQTIVSDGANVLWYIESRNTVWESTPTGTSNLTFEPRKVVELAGAGFDWEAFRTKKLFGWVADEARYVLTPRERTTYSKLELIIDLKTKRLMRVDLYDLTGKLQATQRFAHYVDFDEGCFPGEVAVTMWTPMGNIKSVSRYRDIMANEKIPAETFELDLADDVAREKLNGFSP